jgi:hypothetical protein
VSPHSLREESEGIVLTMDEVLEVGVAAVAPVHHVVRVGPPRGAIAARPHAVTIAHPERGAGGTGRHPQRPADVDHRRVRAEQHPADARVTVSEVRRA